MDDDLLKRLARFETRSFPKYREEYRRLVAEGQTPRTLFIGCSDSRIVPYLLTGTGPGDLFIVRNVGNLIPPYDAPGRDHGTPAAIEFAVLKLARARHRRLRPQPLRRDAGAVRGSGSGRAATSTTGSTSRATRRCR